MTLHPDLDLYCLARSQGATQVEAARAAYPDSDDVSDSTLANRATRLEADPRVKRRISTVNLAGRKALREAWRQSVRRLSAILHDPASTNLDVISASRVVGQASGDLRERTDISVNHVVTFKALVEPADRAVIEAKAAHGRATLADAVASRALPPGPQDGATPTTPPGESVYKEVPLVQGVVPASFSLEPPGDPVAEYAPPVADRDRGYGDAWEACQRTMQELLDRYEKDGDDNALRQLVRLERDTDYRLPHRKY